MDYFYEHESELFTFYRVPKVLFTEEPFKNMNCEAKLLYGLLLDKMGLSRKSGWFDKQGRAFVYYGISHIMEDLGCAHSKAEKLLSELEHAAAQPAQMAPAADTAAPETAGVGETIYAVSPKIRKSNFLTFDFRTSRTLKISVQVR